MDREPPREAIHEAGHAVIASALGRELVALRLRPRPALEARLRAPLPRGRPRSDRDRALLEGEMMVVLSGLAAERVLRVATEASLSASVEDLSRATELAIRIEGRARAEAAVAHFSAVVERMLEKRAGLLRQLARALDEAGALEGEALRRLL
jgi:hypothetical protein